MIQDKQARIFLVDDHRIVRLGFRTVLEELGHFEVAGEAGSGEEALEGISRATPDLAVVDIAMRGMDGIELTRALKREHPNVHVLIVSMHDDTYYVERALEAGADGYLLKDNADALMVDAVERILEGKQYLCGDIQGKIGRS